MDADDPVLVKPTFDDVPVLIREHGRARGFERLRDIVLEHPESLGTENLLAVLKAVIELDRHALFSEVSEAKARERMDRDAWEKFQEYLRGDDVTVETSEKPAARKRTKEGKISAKRSTVSERAPLREGEGVLGLLRGTDSAGSGSAGPTREHPESV